MQFRLLGPLEVQSDRGVLPISGALPRRLLAVLLVHARTVVSADRLIDILWGDEPPAEARQSLWSCVSRLRHALAEHSGAVAELLITRPPGYVLLADRDHLDASLFERLVSGAALVAADRPDAAALMLDEALALWRGPALHEFADEPFAAAEAARLEEVRLSANEDRFQIELVLGADAQLIATLRGFTDAHPLRERPRRQLMLALYRCGRQAEALETYRSYRGLLDRELGVEPSVSLDSLHTQLLRQDPELERSPSVVETEPIATAVDAPNPSATGHSGLPLEVTSFVGREQDVAEVAAAIGATRLVTLTGVGGVGKTRLAIRGAAAGSHRFGDGLSWCELAPVTDPSAVAPALATSLGVRRAADASVVESIVGFLMDKRMLLVLDNCEHLLVGIRPLVTEVLRACPWLVVLATSRERLAVEGEQVCPVRPLPLPDRSATSEMSNPAVSLFVDRARAVRPDLRLDEKNLAHIADVCVHLDGLPLALELAAARVRSLNPADLSDRVRARLDLLSPAGEDHSGRHDTLRTVLDWSYGLLSIAHRQLFDRLSVFAGTFDLTAAEAVCSGGASTAEPVVDLMTSLVDASMINVGATEGTVRYSLLETLRNYGAEHLHQDREADAIRFAHAFHYARAAEDADRGLRGVDEAIWVKIVHSDLDNYRAAHRWMVRLASSDLALRLCRGLRYYMLFRFRDEVVGWGEATLELPGAAAHPLYAEVCGAVGEGVTVRGEMVRAVSLAEGALSKLTDHDDARRMYVLRVAGMVALYLGRLDDGFRQHAEMLRLARMHDHPYETGMALLGLAQSRTYAGEPARGLAFAEEQYRAVRPLGNPSMLALAWYDQAEALSIIDPARAVQPYQRAIDLAQSAGSSFVEGIALVGLASLLGRSGEPRDALPRFRSIIGRWRQMGVWHHQWTTLRNLVQLFLRERRWESAAVLLSAIDAANSAAPAFGADAELVQAARARLEDALGRSSWLIAQDRGAAMSRDETVIFACEAIDQAVDSHLAHQSGDGKRS